jgi:erythrin-vacuolar iron transport family protein
MIPAFSHRRRFSDLSEQEILALAISSEEDDAQIYRTYAERLRADYPPRPRSSTAWPPRRTSTAAA